MSSDISLLKYTTCIEMSCNHALMLGMSCSLTKCVLSFNLYNFTLVNWIGPPLSTFAFMCYMSFCLWILWLVSRWAATMHWCPGMSCSLTKYERSDGSCKINNSVGTVLCHSAGSNAINLLFVILLLELNSFSLRWAAAVYSDLDTGCSLTKYVAMRNTMMYVVIGDDYWALIGAKLIVI